MKFCSATRWLQSTWNETHFTSPRCLSLYSLPSAWPVWLVINLSFVCVFFCFSLSCGCLALWEQGEVSQKRLLLERDSVCMWEKEMHWSNLFGEYRVASDPRVVSEWAFLVCAWFCLSWHLCGSIYLKSHVNQIHLFILSFYFYFKCTH